MTAHATPSVCALQTLNVHTDSVWCLAATADFGLVYSGGRDRAVYCTHMVMRKAWLLAREQQPIRSIVGDVMLTWLAAVVVVTYTWLLLLFVGDAMLTQLVGELQLQAYVMIGCTRSSRWMKDLLLQHRCNFYQW
jgi:hypothetical protein